MASMAKSAAKKPAAKAAAAKPAAAKAKKLETKKAEKAPKEAAAPKKEAVIEVKPAKAAKAAPAVEAKPAKEKTQKTKKSEAKVDKTSLSDEEKKWVELHEKHQADKAQTYDMKATFEANRPLQHKILGWGWIMSNDNDRLEVLFQDGKRILISNYNR